MDHVFVPAGPSWDEVDPECSGRHLIQHVTGRTGCGSGWYGRCRTVLRCFLSRWDVAPDPLRVRKLLLHAREIARLLGAIQRQGMTLVPLKMYFNARGIAKVELGLARGKKIHDKRETEKKRDWQRQKGRLLREKG